MRRTVRWNTEYEEGDLEALMELMTDDVARALDHQGWMIVPKPGGPADDGRRWPMLRTTGYVLAWAEDLSPPATVLRLVPKPRD
jgi:hypothetical protein